jgi:hypothetical protein
MIIHKNKKIKFPQESYDSLFYSIENNLRELGFGDVAVNNKMKVLNKILYDILLKVNETKNDFKLNKELVSKYFVELNNLKVEKYLIFEEYFNDFYNFCFELRPTNMIKDAIKFKV